MPVPLAAPVIMNVGRYILTAGAKNAAKKYGDDVVKKIQKSDTFKELKEQIIESRKLSAKKSVNNKKFKSKENTIQDNSLLKKRAEERVLDLDNPPIEEIPLRFDMNAGGLLSDDRQVYGIGGLVTKLFKLAKKKQPKEVKEQDNPLIQNLKVVLNYLSTND